MVFKSHIVKQQVEDFVTAVVCDRCRKEIDLQRRENHEYLSFQYDGGYFSEYPGDLRRIEFELCEDCLKELFGGFAREVDLALNG